MCDSPFVVKLYETYNSISAQGFQILVTQISSTVSAKGPEHLYLLLELALGGELYATYNKRNMWGNEPCAKIVFRDLKPENLLLTDQGRVKLTDMGLAKVIHGTWARIDPWCGGGGAWVSHEIHEVVGLGGLGCWLVGGPMHGGVVDVVGSSSMGWLVNG
eukprot:Skav206741  [mRNA]  locus=scaffold1022:22166:24766:+ [translate_table: standard]